jgi:hypothetical protein
VKPAVSGIADLASAIGTERYIGGDECSRPGARRAVDDLEPGQAGRLQLARLYRRDTCEGRSFPRQPLQKGRYCSALSFHLDDDASGAVADHTCQPQRGGEAVDKRPEADSLDRASHER